MDVGSFHNESFEPGDRIVLCHEGGVFRSSIYLGAGGVSGSPITYGRLMARPVATLCLDCKTEAEQVERRKRVF